MADPICRWRNPFVPTVMELIDLLPKEELSRAQARDRVEQRSRYNFYKTPYQLACQLGLYHETDGRYYPKFTFNQTEEEVKHYLTNWIIHYCIPNPYTNGFEDLEPFSIHAEICKKLYQFRNPIDWAVINLEIFKQNIGNTDILINSINAYSPILSISKEGEISLKEGKNYEDLITCIDVDICKDRTDKEYFFDLFTVSDRHEDPEHGQIEKLATNITQQDIDLIFQLQEKSDLTQTEKNQIIKARIGQGYFRRSLLNERPYCPITLIDEPKLLIASHIKPWRVSDNRERLNYKNGILLTPTFDRLFDGGLISFRDDKSLIISPQFSDSNVSRLQLTPNMVIPHLLIEGREAFLAFHRNVVLKK
jgi:hypothetical protein